VNLDSMIKETEQPGTSDIVARRTWLMSRSSCLFLEGWRIDRFRFTLKYLEWEPRAGTGRVTSLGLRVPPPRAATPKLEMGLVYNAGHGSGTSITRRPRELPGGEPGCFVPDARLETGIKFGKLPLEAGLAFARHVCLR
jgi:hypothetical protein